MGGIVSNLYYGKIFDEDHLLYARIKDQDTGEDRLYTPTELVDPKDIEVGDEEAYKVSLIEVIEQEKLEDEY